jgi:hypothetical protein
LIFYRRTTQEQNTQAYAAINRLLTAVLMQQQLLERARRAHEDAGSGVAPPSNPEKSSLQRKSEDLRAQVANSNPANGSALQNQLTAVEGHLDKLETGGTFARTIIRSYEPSVCLIRCCAWFPRSQ